MMKGGAMRHTPSMRKTPGSPLGHTGSRSALELSTPVQMTSSSPAALQPTVRGNVSVRNLISRFQNHPKNTPAFTSRTGPVYVPRNLLNYPKGQ